MKKVLYKNGFTLIELMLVAAILVVVGMALYGTFASGISIWRRVTQRSETEDVGVFLKNISYDLRNSFKITGIKFRGGKAFVSFPTEIKYRDSEEFKDMVGQVSYTFDRKTKTIYKRQSNYSEIYRQQQGRKRALAEGISSLQFQYLTYNKERKQFSWVNSWQESDDPFAEEVEENLPLIVKVEVGIPKGNFEEKFIKTITVPSACCWPFLEE